MTGVTQLPAPVAAAASWDTALMRRYGATIGAEERGKGVGVNLAPTVNIVRDPRWGRAFESFSEDPFLTASMAVADIQGIQGEGIMAQVKHWAVYNQETFRNTPDDDAIVDERAAHEIYMPAFEAAVRDADVASAMCSYSVVNDIVRVRARRAADRRPEGSVRLRRLRHVRLVRDALDGRVGQRRHGHADARRLVLRRSAEGRRARRLGAEGARGRHGPADPARGVPLRLLRPPACRRPERDGHLALAHAATARDAAEQGTVLLKNAHGALPLDAGRLHSIAVIGQGGGERAMTAGGGSAGVRAPYVVTPTDAIAKRAGKGVTVRFAQGTNPTGALPPVPAAVLAPPSGSGHGLQGDYFLGQDPTGSPALTRTDPQVDFNWDQGSPDPTLPVDHFSARWTGTLTPPTTGSYELSLTSDDGSRLFVDGQQVIDNWRDQAPNTETAQVALTAGQPVQIEVDYYENGGAALVSLGWLPPAAQTPLQEAVDAAKRSDVAVVFADKFESEGGDLSDIDLPADQNELIAQVAKVNPNTIVVLNTGSAVTMPWLDKVKGVLEAWYPGQEDGNAIAALLFGDANPSGKLPVTFPKSLAQVPASTPQQWPGVGGKVLYSEGLRRRLSPLTTRRGSSRCSRSATASPTRASPSATSQSARNTSRTGAGPSRSMSRTPAGAAARRSFSSTSATRRPRASRRTSSRASAS